MALGGVAASPRDVPCVPCSAVAWIAAKRGAGGYWMQFMVFENGWNWWLSERPEFFNFYWTISNQAIDKYNKLTQINGIWAWNNCEFANKNRSKWWFLAALKVFFSNRRLDSVRKWRCVKTNDLSQRVPLRGYGYSTLVVFFNIKEVWWLHQRHFCEPYPSLRRSQSKNWLKRNLKEMQLMIMQLVVRNVVDGQNQGPCTCSPESIYWVQS